MISKGYQAKGASLLSFKPFGDGKKEKRETIDTTILINSPSGGLKTPINTDSDPNNKLLPEKQLF